MKCDWMVPEDTSQSPGILVMDAVMILAPYTPERCKERANEQRLRERVQKVLGGILKKLAEGYAAKGLTRSS